MRSNEHLDFSFLLRSKLIPGPITSTDFKLALKSALYDFIGARDFYREATSASGMSMHRDMVLRYIELQALLIAPIAPHWAEHIWLEILRKVCLL